MVTHRIRSILLVSTTTSSTSTSLSGIFAKFVAKFLVKWVKKTLGIGQAERGPALTSTPSEVTGRPERDRSRENFGAHTGSGGARAFDDPGEARTIQGDDYGAHRGTLEDRPYRHLSPEERRAALWSGGDLDQQRQVLRGTDPGVLREYGLNDKQVEQCRHGRVPSGHLMDRVATNGRGETDLSQQNWVMSPITPESQLLTNSFHNQVLDIRIGETRILAIPTGGSHVVLVMGAAA